VIENGKLTGMMFEKLEYDISGAEITATRSLGDVFIPCDDVILAIGQENAFPGSKNPPVSNSTNGMCRRSALSHFSRRCPRFSSAAMRPLPQKHHLVRGTWPPGAISIHKYCQQEPVEQRLPRGVKLSSRKMGIHEWAYKNEYNGVEPRLVPHVGLLERFKKINIEVELGFTAEEAASKCSAA